MRVFLAAAAILAWVFAAMLLLAPAAFYEPVGITLTPLLATVAQAHGATLFGLGVVNWLARNADRRGMLAVLTGNLVVQALSLGVVVRTWSLNPDAKALPGAMIHIVLGALCAYFLLRARRAEVQPGEVVATPV
jgi:hypothetical protein